MSFNVARVLALGGLLLLAGCGGGSSSSTEAPTTDPVTGEELALLPQVSAGGRQFADPNVLVVLRGSATAADGATIASTQWTQIEGPDVVIPNPGQLENAIVVPDLEEETELAFRLIAEDSEGRVNSSVAFLFVRPLDAFARVIGGTVNEQDAVASFTVKLNAPQATETTVNYATRAGTAEEGTDYVATQGTLLFAAGETEKIVSVTIIDSDAEEESEYFSLDITVVSPQNPSSNSGIMLIVNNPSPIVISDIEFVNPGPVIIAVEETVSNPIDPQSITGTGALSYSSGNTEVAIVDQQGRATAFSIGTTTITATKAADATAPESTASYELVVIPAPELLDIPVVDARRVSLGLALFSGTATIDWNDGSPAVVVTNQLIEQLNGAGSSTHDYAQNTSGNITISFSDGLSSVRALQTNADSFQFDISILGGLSNVEVLNFFGQNSAVNGSLSSLSSNSQLRELQLFGNNGNLSGDIADLPPNLTVFNAGNDQGTYSGVVADIPAGMVRFTINNPNTMSGNIADIPSVLENFSVDGSNTITGVVVQIPANVTSFRLVGANTLAGNIEDLHIDMRSFNVSGLNTVAGDLGLLQNNGNLSLIVNGRNTITADVANIATAVTTLSLGGFNTLFGDIQNLHSSFNFFAVNGSNTISGDLAALVNDTNISITVGGQNTIRAIVAGIPSSIISLSIGGNNTISGNIQDLHTSISVFDINGANTIGGDLGLLPSNSLSRLIIRGGNTIDQFTDPPFWTPARIDFLILENGGSAGFTAETVDNILIYLNNQLGTAAIPAPRIVLDRFADEPRTSASDAAVAGLATKRYQVTTNEIIPE